MISYRHSTTCVVLQLEQTKCIAICRRSQIFTASVCALIHWAFVSVPRLLGILHDFAIWFPPS